MVRNDMSLDNYIYQYDLDGFPVPRVLDIARRMKYHKVKLYKKCCINNCPNETLNKPTHHFCLDHFITNIFNNSTISEYIEEKMIIEPI